MMPNTLFTKLNKPITTLTKSMQKSKYTYCIVFILCLILVISYMSREGFRSGHPHHPHPHPHPPHPHPHPHPPHPRPHPHPPYPPPHRRRWWDILTFSWVPGFLGTCKNGCSYLGNGSWGCTYPGYGSNDCMFATDCRWCGNYVYN